MDPASAGTSGTALPVRTATEREYSDTRVGLHGTMPRPRGGGSTGSGQTQLPRGLETACFSILLIIKETRAA